MSLTKRTTLPALFLSAALLHGQQPDLSPATIYIHGNILTGAHLRPGDNSPTPEQVSALAVTNSTIVAVGTDEQILKLKGARTQVVDLGGAFVMPGFNDAHTNIAEGGQQLLSVNLAGTSSLAEMLERIRVYTAKARPGDWIVGSGWDQTLWASKQIPTRTDLDAVTAGHPAYFVRMDGHSLVANSAALLSSGISSATVAPQGSQIDHDASGTPTGIVHEAPAMALLFNKLPTPSPELRRKALELSIANALAHGVTSVQDLTDWNDWLTLESMEHTGRLNLRISSWLDFNLPLGVLQERRASHDANDPLLHLGMLQTRMDGSLDSRTAALSEPYKDDPNNYGLPRYQQNKLNEMASERAAAGFQLGFHAVGDLGDTIALDTFSAAEQVGRPATTPAPPKNPDAAIVTSLAEGSSAADLRLRIEYAQVVEPDDFERFKSEGVIASMQPAHLLTDMAWVNDRLGPERAKHTYAWRSMLDHGIPLAFGSDYPAASISPFPGLYAAVTRKNVAGTMSFHPEQAITIQQAIYAYTQGSAYAEFREDRKGRLEPGYLADFIVLDHDLLTASPVEILHTKVLETIVGGKVVFGTGIGTGAGTGARTALPSAATPPAKHLENSFVPN